MNKRTFSEIANKRDMLVTIAEKFKSKMIVKDIKKNKQSVQNTISNNFYK